MLALRCQFIIIYKDYFNVLGFGALLAFMSGYKGI